MVRQILVTWLYTKTRIPGTTDREISDGARVKRISTTQVTSNTAIPEQGMIAQPVKVPLPNANYSHHEPRVTLSHGTV
jgi:hypothetical protein